MAGAISINILSNVREAVRGADDVADALGDAHDALRDLTKEGDTASDRLTADFKDVSKASAKSADEIRDKMRAAYREVRSQSDDTADKAKKDFGKAGEATTEFKEEALSNLSEVASSFDGSMESVGDLVQGTIGGVTANLGLIGLAAAPAAASVGVITDAFVKAKESSDEARESAYTYGLTVAATGDYADIAGRINELTGSVEGLKNIQEIATVAGWEQEEVLKALASGDGLPALAAAFNDGANNATIASGRVLELQGVLDGTKQGLDLATGAADINAKALFDLAVQAGEATGKTDELGNAIVRMPDGKEIVVNAQTQTAYEDIQAIENLSLSTKDVRVRMYVDDTAFRNWQPGVKYAAVEPINPFAGRLLP